MKIKISKSQWEKIGKMAGWDKEENFEVIDNAFNKENYPDLVGKVFSTPPSYAQVKKTSKKADFENVAEMKKGKS